MAKKKSPTPAPLTFDLPLSLIEKIEAIQGKLGEKSISAVVRLAVQKFDVDGYECDTSEHRQISVRLPAGDKAALVKAAKKKRVSVGELLRVAVEALEVKPAAKAAAKPTAKKARK